LANNNHATILKELLTGVLGKEAPVSTKTYEVQFGALPGEINLGLLEVNVPAKSGEPVSFGSFFGSGTLRSPEGVGKPAAPGVGGHHTSAPDAPHLDAPVRRVGDKAPGRAGAPADHDVDAQVKVNSRSGLERELPDLVKQLTTVEGWGQAQQLSAKAA